MSQSPANPLGVKAPADLAPGQPYCGACGYSLVGATESAKCPECGAPLVEAMQRKGAEPMMRGRRWRSGATVFGFPVVDVAFGPDESKGERMGKPRGLIALGDMPVGGVAIGGMPVGVVSVGGMSVGVCTLGGLSLGALTAFGGMAVSLGMAVGGMAMGAMSFGGVAIGYFARGGTAIGRFARGGRAFGQHTIDRRSNDPIASQAFADVAWFYGSGGGPWQPALVLGAVFLILTAAIGLLAILRLSAGSKPDPFRDAAESERR
ncbi:MAG: hypothetical protein ACTS27_03910 [Phycisphaerales bacterium]